MYLTRSHNSTRTQRVLDAIYYRYHQASLLRSWRLRDPLHICASELNPIRQHFPSLYAVSLLAIETLDPFQVGYFLTTMRNCAIMSCIVLMQQPSPEQLQDWCEQLRLYIVINCIRVEWGYLDLSELTTLLQLWLDERRASDGRWRAHEAAFSPLDNVENVLGAELYNGPITGRFWRCWMAALNPVIRDQLTFRQFVRVSRGLRYGEMGTIGVPDVNISPDELFQTIEVSPEEYRAVGERIALDAFCKEANELPTESTCTVCLNYVKINAIGKGEKPVVTACGHFFHEVCIDSWVNDSAASTSHTCPSCRAVMCQRRPRVPASMVEAPGRSTSDYSRAHPIGGL
ncbi:hypothetical protein BDU57DRAFT_526300 [Ampelomyces quisqualis]|uniref:RING-type domain-containing protein n=1 Tax=Ampelomyces quisqualis TaxID=50730 RepID=A0A6A5R3U1_AMPQU|nr:hypothetical protein BDU57DRAFT_526300 [Ampelomyces quisqualis]